VKPVENKGVSQSRFCLFRREPTIVGAEFKLMRAETIGEVVNDL
jgi:hypothetical protein